MEKRVLIVESEATIHALLERIFETEDMDYQVSTVPDMPAVLPLLLKNPFDVVLLDQHTADRTWLKLAHIVRAFWPESRVLLMMGDDPFLLDEQQEAEAFDAFIQKPFTLQELMDKIERF
ncbi:MAG: response regulator [Anaerolineales bacterium]|nr:response regulator [Anaerolineales bacterium]